MVTQKNLLKAQLQLGAGQPLPFTRVESKGHAIEVRITSEDPYDNFKPSTGRILHYKEPTPPKTGRKRLRVDSGVEAGREISQYYDSMIAKLIVWGETRGDAVEALQQALSEFEILGVKTNIPFLKALVATPEFREQRWGDTKFITDVFLKSPAGQPNYKDYQEALVTAAIQTYLGRKESLITSQAFTRGDVLDPNVELEFEGTKYETTVYERAPGQFLVRLGDSSVEVGVSRKDYVYTLDLDGVKRRSLIRAETGSREVLLDNVAYEIKVIGEGELGPGYILPPMPGKVIKLYVKPGDQVGAGQPVVRVEAMKMENDILSPVSGTVKEVFVQENANVEFREKLVFIETAEEVGEGSAAVETEAEPPTFNLSPTLYSRISDGSKPNYDSRRALMADTSALFEGYDAPTDMMASLLPRIKPSGVAESRAAEKGMRRLSRAVGFPSARAHFHADLESWIEGLVDRFVTVETVFLPVHRGKLVQYLQSGEIPEGSYGETLQKALNFHEGVSPDQAFFLLNKSHERRAEKAKLLSIILPWIPELKMAGLGNSLDQLRGLYVSGVPRSFQTQVAESRRLLQQGLAGERNGNNLEDALEPLFKRRGQRREEGYAEFLRKPGVELHFLLDQARHGKNITRRHVASNLIQRYLYGRRYRATYSKNVRPGYRTDMEPLPGMTGEPIHLFTGRIEKVGNPNLVIHKIEQGLAVLPSSKDSSAGTRVVELIFQHTPSAEDLSQLEGALAERFQGADLSRVTLILPKSDGIGFHTYAPEEPGGPFREQTLLRNIHPVAARDLQLERWTENFQVERRDMGLYDHVHAYQAVERNPANKRLVDRRHFVIGEHRGALSYERFDGERVRNRLIGDFRALRKNPNYRLDEDSQIAWSWLPHALQETGVLGAGFDPFSIGVLRASPREMIDRFELTEDKLTQVAEFYDDKVKIVPEAEKTAYDTALVMLKLQETVKRPLPANVDLFIHEPVEMTDAEIKLLAFRLTPGFMGQSIEKTTVHFCRREDGRVRHYIAEIKIPGQTRFEVTFKPSLVTPPPHRPRSEIEHRRIGQQSKGKLYVYDRVNLFHDVVKDFYPKGNVPPEAVRVQELILNEAGELVPTDRPPGQNDMTKVAFLVNFKMPQDIEAQNTIERQFIVIADDYALRDENYNSMAGSQGRREGQLYRAVSDYAVEHGIPKLYLAESSGARIGFADEVKPFVHLDQSDKSIYVLPADLDTIVGKTKQPLRDLIRVGNVQELIVDETGSRVSVADVLKGLGEPYANFLENLEAERERVANFEKFLDKVEQGEAELELIPETQRSELEGIQKVLTAMDRGDALTAANELGGSWGSLNDITLALGDSYEMQYRHPISAIIGEGEINTESLNASGMAGGSESRTRSRHGAHLPTATITFGTTIGIATYLARLSEFVIMVKNSFLGLTGFRAINDVLGTKYTDQLEVAGPDIMRENGVAYKVVENERDALRAYMQWLSYQPIRQGEAPPHLEFNDPVDRDISEEVNALIQGAGQSYSTQALDGLIYDRGSVWYVQDDGHYGRYANTGFATLGGTPVGIISMEMSPKLRDGEKAVFPPPGGPTPPIRLHSIFGM
jgi:acetyl-CoA carboxylase carboxyltransferase component